MPEYLKTELEYEVASLKPTSDTGLYLVMHEHDWEWFASSQGHEIGHRGTEWHPVFRCWCGSVLFDSHVVLHGKDCHAETPSHLCTLEGDHEGDHIDVDGKPWKRGSRGVWEE